MLLRSNGSVRPELVDLARMHGFAELGADIDPQVFLQGLQERWTRKTDHQYQIPGRPPEAKENVLLVELELLDKVKADLGWTLEGALLLGATVVGVRKRLSYLLEQYDRGLRFKRLYLLGGARPLDVTKESSPILCSPAELPFKPDWTAPSELPTTEAGMMQLVFDQSDLPGSWEAVLIDTPLQPTADGKTRHPNTMDTVKMFAQCGAQPGMYVAVSSQPFVARQKYNVQDMLPTGYIASSIGYSAPMTTPLKTYLDEICRLLHEELRHRQS